MIKISFDINCGSCSVKISYQTQLLHFKGQEDRDLNPRLPLLDAIKSAVYGLSDVSLNKLVVRHYSPMPKI